MEKSSEFTLDKAFFKDTGGRYRTQSLFLESTYDRTAPFTFRDYHHKDGEHTYWSLGRLYVELSDPTEYEFACKYLEGWKHWQRMLENKVIRKYIDEWRSELEMKIRSQAVKKMIYSAEEGNYQAAKWLADRGWASRGAGRPSKIEIEGEKAFQSRLGAEYGADVLRLLPKKDVA